jgi:hypothetical protein
MNKILENFILPGLGLLPERMDTPEARAMLLAIGLQESRFEHRKQVKGPARSFWQFELSGINGVLTHKATSMLIKDVCKSLVIEPFQADCYEAITYNDPLACCFARLLLWTLPDKLAGRYSPATSWLQYLSAWRPGKPRLETWETNFNAAWAGIYEKETA